jgi:hypothetical protein
MGLLDDAIRDHLDLKRRRGADPTDIERAEREALGPVRRDPFEHAPQDFDSALLPDDGPRAYDHEEELYDDEGYEEYGVEEEWEGDFEDQPGEPHLAPGETAEAGQGELSDSTALMDHEYLEEPRPPVADEPAAPPSYPAEADASDETMQYDVEEALASERSQAEPSSEWVEQSDEWVEQSEEWVEPSHPPVEPSHEPVEPPPAEPGAQAAEPGAPYFEPEEYEEPAPHAEPGVPPPTSHDPETERGAKPEEDVLEETPEYLHEAPDHDQLWFEQRPPRDFDFDG